MSENINLEFLTEEQIKDFLYRASPIDFVPKPVDESKGIGDKPIIDLGDGISIEFIGSYSSLSENEVSDSVENE